MKKLILLAILFYGISCTNPEDSVNNHTDSAKDANTEGHTLNNTLGPTNNDKNTSTGLDTSRDATTGTNGATNTQSGPAGSGKSTDTTGKKGQ
jgi:hypothetical protein